MRQSAFGVLDSHTGWAGWEAAAHGPGDAVTIPDAQLLFGGEYKRAGTDLILSNHDHEFVVHDYFRNGNRPTLLSADGGRVAADIVEALTGLGHYAQAGAPAQTAPTVVGRVVKFDGNATVIRNGVAVSLQVGDGILKGDVLQTGSGTMAVTFNDGSTLNLSANSRLVVSDFVYDPNGTHNSELLNLVQGTLTAISGGVAHTHGDMEIRTPIATMGIRGTELTIQQNSDGSWNVTVGNSSTPNDVVIKDTQGNVIKTIEADNTLTKLISDVQGLALQQQPLSPAEQAQLHNDLLAIVNYQKIGEAIVKQQQDTQSTGSKGGGTDPTKPADDGSPSQNGNPDQHSDNSTTTTFHVVSTDESGNTHSVADLKIPLPEIPTPPAINHAPQIDHAPIVTEVPIPSHQPNDGTDPNAVHEVAPAMSHDGRWIAFSSDEINPDSNNNNNNNPDTGDVLLYDRLTGVTTVLTDATHIPLIERQVGETFSDPSISGNGSTVVFRGEHATGNAPGHGPSSIANIYVYDRASNTTHVLTNPNNGNTPYTVNDPVSIGGGHIVFVSDDFGDNTGPPIRHIYVTDLSGHIQTDIQPGTVGITEPSDPNQSQTEFQQPDISGNGQYLTFWTVAHTFDSIAGTNTQVGPATLYTYDRSNGNYQIIATSSGNDGDNWLASMSGDGRYVVFQSDSNTLDVQVGGVANSHMDVFVFDRRANDGLGGIIGITDNASFQANGASERASISDAGNDIIFASLASNLVAGDTNGQGDTFVYDVLSNTFTRVSVASDGAQGNGDNTLGADISGGHFFQGALVTFGSTAGNLVTPNDTDNGQSDIFVVDRTGGIIGSVTEDDTTPAYSGAPLTGFLSTHGAFNFSDADLSDAHTILLMPGVTVDTSGAPGFTVPDGGLGTFTPTLVDSSGTGHGEVAWNFKVDNALVQGLNGGQRISEVYAVQIDDGQGGVVTQDVTIVLGGTPYAPEIQGPAQEFVQTPADSNTYDKQGQIAFSDPDLTDSHHVQVFFDAAASSSWAQAHFVPSYNADDTVITSDFGTFTVTQINSETDSTGGGIGNVQWDFNLDSQLPSGTEIVFDIHVIDGVGQDAVQEVVVHSPGPGTWISSTGGDWGTADSAYNWYHDTTPVTADDVFITKPVGQTVTFNGAIDGQSGFASAASLTVAAGVTFDLTHHGSLFFSGDLHNDGLIDVLDSGLSIGGNGNNSATGTINVHGTSGFISSTLDINGSFANTGTVTADARGEASFGSVTGAGELQIAGGAITIDESDRASSADVVDTNDIEFTASNGILLLGGQGRITGHISGFGVSDSIAFLDERVTVTSYVDNGDDTGVLTLHLHPLDGDNESDLSLLLNGDYALADFVAQFDGLNTLLYDEPSGIVQSSTNGVWTNAAGGDWGIAGNWHNNAVPGAGDDIVLDTPVGQTVTFNGGIDGIPGYGLAQVGSLSVGGGVTFQVTQHGDLFFQGDLANHGAIAVLDSSVSASGDGTNSDTITVTGTSGLVSATFDINGSFANTGTVIANARGEASFGSVSGSGLLKIDGGALALDELDTLSSSDVADTNNILFDASNSTLILGGQGQIDGHISGFAAGDSIFFLNEQVIVAGYVDNGDSTGVLTLHLHPTDGGGDSDLTLLLNGDYVNGEFAAQFDGLNSQLFDTLVPVQSGGGTPNGVWTNAAGGDWGTAANWSNDTVPGAFDVVVFDTPVGHTVTFNGGIDGLPGYGLAQAGSLDVGSGVTFQVTHHGDLFFEGDFDNSGAILVSDSSVSASDDGSNASGSSITVEGSSGLVSATLNINGAFTNNGTVIAGAHGEAEFGSVGGAGLLVIDGGAINIGGADTNDVQFSTASTGALLLGDASHFDVNISGFASDLSGDTSNAQTIGVLNANLAVHSYTENIDGHSGMLDLHPSGGGADILLNFYGDYTAANFQIQVTSGGETDTFLYDEGPVISTSQQQATGDQSSTTLSGLQVFDAFNSGDQFTITATAGHGTLTLFDDSNVSGGTISETTTLGNINSVLADGVIYTPDSPTPTTDSVTVRIADAGPTGTLTNGAVDELHLIFNVSSQNDVTLTGTNGKDIVYGTGYNDTLTGGASSDTFVFREFGNVGTPNTDTITDFNMFQDYLNFDQAHFATTAAILAATTDVNGHAVITVDDTNHNTIGTISLTNVTTAQLTAHQDHILLAA